MKLQNINFSNYINFGEMNYLGTVVTVSSLNNPKKTILLGDEFDMDVFEYARKKAKLPKDYNMRNVISMDNLFKLTNTSTRKARKKELIKILLKQGLLKK